MGKIFLSGLYKDVKNVEKSCLTCARTHSTVDYRNMKLVVAIYPFQIIFLDTGCFAYGNDNKFYFVVAINHFTQWIEVRILRKEKL